MVKKKYTKYMITVFFGGAFDPFHSEHRALVEGAKESLHADRVVVYPSFCPPHKESPSSSFDVRLKMVKKGTEDLPYVIIDTIEKERNKTNYSYEVIPLLKEKYPSDRYYFLVGGDSMIHFSTWKEPEKIAEEITLAVAERADTVGLNEAIQDAKKLYNANIVCLDVVGKSVSSSQIKARAELGLPQVDVCQEVEKIIKEENLYRQFSDIIIKLRSSIPQKTFEHVSRTVLYALKLNTELNLPYKKVFLSACLHDCTKHLSAQIEGVPAPVVHQYTGAKCAKEVYGIDDEDIIKAIECHTTGKPEMSTLEKLIFCADVLEEGRDYPGVKELRTAIESDFEKGFRLCLKSCYDHVVTSGKPFDMLTKACAVYYNVI